MGKIINSLSNGPGALITRILVTIFMGVIVFLGRELALSIRIEFADMKEDNRAIRKDISWLRENLISKTLYYQDKRELRHELNELRDQMHKYHTFAKVE
jgi:5-bromo-4-chloroindolyl phosphate hydrolysis protein